MQNLVARRERKEVLEEEEEEEEEESRERETLKCNFLYILKICSVYIFYQCPTCPLNLIIWSTLQCIGPILPFLFVQRGEIYLTTLRSAPEGRNIRKI